jgi:hypothetical protein
VSSRRDWLTIGAAALAFRLVSAALAFLAHAVFPNYQPEPFAGMWGSPSAFWDPFTRYDAGWYYQIARYGYEFVTGGPSAGVGKPGKIAYFPVYPYLMRYAGRLFGRRTADVFLGGIAVSWTAFILGMIVLFYLARLDLPRRLAGRAVLLCAIFPFAFFYGVVYGESTFLLCAVTTFYCFRTRRWLLGGLSGALATAARPNGIMMVPALAWIAWRGGEPRSAAERARGAEGEGPARSAADRVRALIGVAITACGLGAYSFYVYRLSGNPFEWAASIQRWGYYPGGAPWLALARLVQVLATHPYAYLAGDRMGPYDALNGVTALMFVIALPFVWKRLGAAYGLFMLANLWLPLSSGQFEGLGRYCAVMFPFFICLAAIRSRTAFISAVVVSALFYTLCLALFATIHPIF